MEKHLQEAVRATGMLMDRKGRLPKRPEGFEDKLSFDQIVISISNWKVLEFMVSLAADLRIPVISATVSGGTRPPDPVDAGRLPERSDAGGYGFRMAAGIKSTGQLFSAWTLPSF
jgi:hypothetical protein